MTYAIYLLRYEQDGIDINEWLSVFSPESLEGFGWVDSSPDVHRALRFADKAEALGLIMTIPRARPARDDGLPNRPLRAFTLEIRELAPED